MNAFEKGAIRDLLFLSLAAGSADAAGFMGLGRVFTSNMTGNTVLFGIALGQGHPLEALRSLYVLFIFLIAACVGAWLARDVAGKGWSFLAARLISIEASLLVTFAVAWLLAHDMPGDVWTWLLIPFLATAMGLQSIALNMLSAPGVATTAITGTMISLMGGLVSWFGPDSATRPTRSRLSFQGSVVGLYVIGATLSGVLYWAAPAAMGLPPALFVSFVAINRWRDVQRR